MPPASLLFAERFSAACPGAWQQVEGGQATRNLSLPKIRTCLCTPYCAPNLPAALNSMQEDISECWDVSICAVLNQSKIDKTD